MICLDIVKVEMLGLAQVFGEQLWNMVTTDKVLLGQ